MTGLRATKRRPGGLARLAILVAGLAACLWPAGLPGESAPKAGVNPYDEDQDSAELAKLPPGERAARRACTMCHAFPEPNLLDKKHWKEQILPRMQVRLGIAMPDWSSSPEGELIRQRKIYTEKPMVPPDDWPLIRDYFLENAPDQPLPQDPRPEITLGLKHFKTEPVRFRTQTPTTTLVKISPATHRIYVGDDLTKSIYLLNADGALVNSVNLGNVPVDVVETERGLWITCIGSYLPSEVYRGEVILLEKRGDEFGEKKVILRDLPRPTHLEFGDFNGDGRLDFSLCMFGNLTGRFSWFENMGRDQYKEHVLSTKAGAMYCYPYDFNGDKKLDLAVVMTQELEMLIIMLNDGKGNFSGDMIWQKPPPWGHSYFELADFNKDGQMDFLVTNGDNGEYESPLKKYHGVRLLLNKGDSQFEDAFFYPLNGAYKAVARDFDEDGDLDIAAIAYFPDYKETPRESFVYLENQGGFKFKASTFRECIAGRWMVMDAADVDGDGDVDIVLGAYDVGPAPPNPPPAQLMNIWRERGGSIQILRNTLR